MNEKGELLFLTRLYNTWPWYYDHDATLKIYKKIVVSQHRELAKNKLKKDYKVKKPKRKISKTKHEFY